MIVDCVSSDGATSRSSCLLIVFCLVLYLTVGGVRFLGVLREPTDMGLLQSKLGKFGLRRRVVCF